MGTFLLFLGVMWIAPLAYKILVVTAVVLTPRKHYYIPSAVCMIDQVVEQQGNPTEQLRLVRGWGFSSVTDWEAYIINNLQ